MGEVLRGNFTSGSRYVRDLDHRIKVLTEWLAEDEGAELDDFCVRVTISVLQKIVDDWEHGIFHA